MDDLRFDTELAQWYLDLSSTSNTAFMPLFADQHRYLVLKGGGGSGKSIFAGRKILERVTSEPGHRWLVCRKVARTLRESCFNQLIGQISEHYPGCGAKINRSDLLISFKNRSQILFAGLDDVEKLKSIYAITGIWIEEASELLESDFNQLDIRLRGETKFYKQIILTFNPISITHWLKRRFFDYPDPNARVSETTYKDNRFLDEDAKQVLESFKDTDDYYYDVYCLGMWGVTGRTVFGGKQVMARLALDIRPVRTGFFKYRDSGTAIDGIEFEDDPDGFIKVYKEPIPGVPYVIGGDTAGEGSDSFVAQVLDNRTGDQVCTMRHSFDEDLFARQIYCLGTWYNHALIGIEANLSTYPIMELERLRYPRQYVRETVDNYTHRPEKRYGFRTDNKTRPVIISELVRAFREDPEIVSDKTTLEEMMTFVRNEEFRAEAEEGAHDDTIMALAIAHHIRPQQSYLLDKSAAPLREWTDDMWEDYHSAARREREILIERWGRPAPRRH